MIAFSINKQYLAAFGEMSIPLLLGVLIGHTTVYSFMILCMVTLTAAIVNFACMVMFARNCEPKHESRESSVSLESTSVLMMDPIEPPSFSDAAMDGMDFIFGSLKSFIQ